MKITSIQKVIKVGDSLAVTIPARDARVSKIKAGDQVKITTEKVDQDHAADEEVLQAAKDILTRYKSDFQNLADR